jgi:hypothetical protein
MTIIEASSILFGHFIKSDSISNEQFGQIKPKKTSDIEAEAAFSYSLAEMETKNIVSKFITANSDGKAVYVWVLKQPLISIPQNVQIDGGTAIAISNICNDFFKQTGNDEEFCNPLQIIDRDLHILMEIIDILAERNVENPEENKDK